MEATIFVYLATVVPQVGSLLGFVGFISFAFSGLFGIFGRMAVDDGIITTQNYKKLLKIALIITVLSATLSALTPDRKTMYMMAGAYLGQQALTSDVAKDAYEIIQLEVKNILEEKRKELAK